MLSRKSVLLMFSLMRRKNRFLIAFFIFALGMGIGYLIASKKSIRQPQAIIGKESVFENGYTEFRQGGYQFISPLLECDNFNPSSLRILNNLKKTVNEYIKNVKSLHKVTHVSVYFRDLNNGPWTGINEHQNYSPASLLKVPILITVLKEAEKNPSLLKKRYTFTGSTTPSHYTNIVASQQIEKGKSYTIEDLLEYMIIYSDNEAKDLLLDIFDERRVAKTIEEFGIKLSEKDDVEDFLSVKEYASFFRILYNATYLNREMSEKALHILSRVEFMDGIPKHLPENIVTATKFGERGFLDFDLKQLHDCGIIYLPNKPYLLCIMTKGNDFVVLAEVISDISLIIYENISH